MDNNLPANPDILFNAVDESYNSAIKNSDEIVKHFRIATHSVNISFAGPELIPYCLPAINHLLTDKSDNTALSISVWDSKSTKTKLPFDLWKHLGQTKNNIRDEEEPEHIRNYFHKQNIRGMYHTETRALSLFDSITNKGYVWYNSEDSVPYFSTSSPFRSIIHWWSMGMGLLLIHASAISYKNSGLLIVGKSGSGKSNTALNSIKSHLNFVGDDHVLVDTKKPMQTFSLYNAFKLNSSDIEKHSDLLKNNNGHDNIKYIKTIFFLDQIAPEKLDTRFKIKFILLPKVTKLKSSRIYPVPPSKALLAIAPNTLFQLPGSNSIDYKRMVKLVRSTPSYILELGSDVNSIPNIISELLNDNNISFNTNNQ